MPIEIKNPEYYLSEKIKEEEEVIKIVEEQKEKGKTVGLCIGGFDLLHPGHMTHLRSARALCDFLVIGVTAEEFNAARKGKGRPVYNDILRCFSLSQLNSVDLVFISKYPKAVEAIKSVKPNYYIKGPDYKDKQTPGITAEREAIKSVGGEIKYTNDEKLSTSELINYIKENVKLNILLIVDRDGTIIEDKDFLGKNQNWKEEISFMMPTLDTLRFIQRFANCKTFVASNQAGVARGYFDCKAVEEINNYLHEKILHMGVFIDGWKYCPDVDEEYAKIKKDLHFNPLFVKSKTKRKPNIDMVIEMLKEKNLSISSFDKILVFGDRDEDKDLANNLGGNYVDVKNKTYDLLKEEFLSKL